MVESNFAFIEAVSTVYYGGQAQRHYVIDNYVEPAVIWRIYTAAMN